MVKKSDLKKLNSIMQEGNRFKNEKKYNKAVEKYLEALNFIEDKVKDPAEKGDELANIKTQIDQIYSVEIIDIIERAKDFIDENTFNEALKTLDDALRIAEKIEDPSLRKDETNEISSWINKTKLEELIYKADTLKLKERYNDAIKILKDTLTDAEEIYKDEPNHELISRIKDALNQNYSLEVNLLIEQGNQVKITGNSEDALNIFKDALKITELYYESNLKTIEINNLRNLINQIYSNHIKPIIEKGKLLLEQNNYEAANKEFNKALEITEKMYDTDQKQTEVARITSIASESINPIYIERIKPIIDEAKKLMIKEHYEQDLAVVNTVIGLFNKALEIAKEMTKSIQKEVEVKQITELINKTCIARINFIKDNSLRKIAQREYDKAVNDLYAAISVAKHMVIPEEENLELEKLKSSVNKAYTSQIDEVLKEGELFLEKKEYEKAIEIFNNGLELTNKMYLNEEMEREVNKIKSLIYQAELKQLIGRGDLAEELKKFEKDIEKLNKKMEYAKTIDDTERRLSEMDKIKTSIDEVHHSEIKLLVEQGIQLAEREGFADAFEHFERAMKINDLIESPEFKNKIPIKYTYKTQLINKAKIEIAKSNYDQAIIDSNKAIELDNAFIDAYFHIGIANNNKHEYDIAIEYFKKALDLSSEHAKSWNYMGFAFEKKGEYVKAIESYKKAVEIDPSYARAFYNMGNSFKHKMQFDSAIQNYKMATEIDPEFALAWFFMGHAYFDKNDYFTGIQYLEKAIILNSDLGSEIQPHIKDFKKTIDTLQEILHTKFTNK